MIALNILIVVAFLALLPIAADQGDLEVQGAFIAFVIALIAEIFSSPLLFFLVSPFVRVAEADAGLVDAVGHWPTRVGADPQLSRHRPDRRRWRRQILDAGPRRHRVLPTRCASRILRDLSAPRVESPLAVGSDPGVIAGADPSLSGWRCSRTAHAGSAAVGGVRRTTTRLIPQMVWKKLKPVDQLGEGDSQLGEPVQDDLRGGLLRRPLS